MSYSSYVNTPEGQQITIGTYNDYLRANLSRTALEIALNEELTREEVNHLKVKVKVIIQMLNEEAIEAVFSTGIIKTEIGEVA